jgi:hypothetical protein
LQGSEHRALRQITLAAEPDAFFRFHLRHLEQRDQHAQPVSPRQPGQGRCSLGNERRGLIGPAVSWFVGL